MKPSRSLKQRGRHGSRSKKYLRTPDLAVSVTRREWGGYSAPLLTADGPWSSLTLRPAANTGHTTKCRVKKHSGYIKLYESRNSHGEFEQNKPTANLFCASTLAHSSIVRAVTQHTTSASEHKQQTSTRRLWCWLAGLVQSRRHHVGQVRGCQAAIDSTQKLKLSLF